MNDRQETAIIATVGDHDCDTPGPQVDLAERLYEQSGENGKAKWRCPVCGSRWTGHVDFYKCRRNGQDDDLKYHRALRWRRVGASSWRWKRRTKREIEAALPLQNGSSIAPDIGGGS